MNTLVLIITRQNSIFYYKCKTHSLKETNEIYINDFNRKLEEDYTIDKMIASF